MWSSVLRRALALGCLAVAPTALAGQQMPTQVKLDYDKLMAKLEAVALPADVKTTLKAQANKAWSPSSGAGAAQDEYSTVDRLMTQSASALVEIEATVAIINADKQLPAGLKSKFLDKVNVTRRMLPYSWDDVRADLTTVKSGASNYDALIGRINAFAASIASSNAPPVLKTRVTTEVSRMLAAMVPDGYNDASDGFRRFQDARTNDLSLVDDVDRLRVKAAGEIPADFPQLKLYTWRQLDALRANIGNPEGATSNSAFSNFESQYGVRLGYARTGVDIIRLTTPKGFADMKAAQKAIVRTRLMAMMILLLDYPGSHETALLGNLHAEAKTFGN